MGWFGRKGKWRTIRANYRELPIAEWTEDEEAHFWKNCTEEEYWEAWDEWSLDTYEHPTIRHLKQSLKCSVLAKWSMENRKHHIKPFG